MTYSSKKRLNAFFGPYVKTIVAGCFMITAANVFLVWIPVFIRETINQVTNNPNLQGAEGLGLIEILFQSEFSLALFANAFKLVGAAILYGLFLFATRQTIIVSSRRIERDVRAALFEKLLALPKSFFTKHRIGDIYVRTSEDVNKLRMYYGPAVMYAANTLGRMGVIIFMMFYVNPTLSLWAMIPLPLLSFLAYFVSSYINKQSRVIQEHYAILAGRAQEAFSSIRLIKAYGREEYELSVFEKESAEYKRKKLKLDLVESLFIPMLSFFIGLSVVIVLWKGGEMVIADQLSVGNIAEFIVYVAYLTWPVASLGYTLNLYQQAMASWERIDYILDYPIQQNKLDDSITSELVDGPLLEFDKVSFKYPGTDQWVLKDISFSLDKGQQLAIVGKTGSGKSTIVQLIPFLFDVTEGEIRVNGINIKYWPKDKLRDLLGYVGQETFLFSDTIFGNIAFGTENADLALVEKAAERAQVKTNILSFTKKFDTIVGERGITLSGGQKQRTAIARALIKNPEILIFDDSLSAVDTKTEEAILNHLRVELENRTSIMISHRISTVQQADKIIVIDEGCIIESGTHQDLITKDGQYSRMYRKQLLQEELNVL
jgi:ATP-binding cassette subfamily B multidrug efflux pump